MRAALALVVAGIFLTACVAIIHGPLDGWPLDSMRQASVEVRMDAGHGSGVLIAPDLVITANHVTSDGDPFKIVLSDGMESEGAVIQSWPDQDAALIRLKTPSTLPPAELACRKPVWGEPVAVVGAPLAGVHWLVAAGTVASVDAMTFPTDDPTQPFLIPINVDLNPGMSGGPIFDKDGKLLGISDAFLVTRVGGGFSGGSESQSGIGLMVPAAVFCAKVQEAMK